ncbi:hypothetical protein OQA88_1904 [Cercophora sp. LCS_1]
MFESTNRFWESPDLDDRPSGRASRTAILKGNFRARFAMREFSVDVIRQLRSKNTPVFWALPGAESKLEDASISVVDVFKHLILQVSQLGHDGTNTVTDGGMALQCARFQRATTERGWLQLLGAALERLRSEACIVVDVSALDRDLQPQDGFSWLSAFKTLFYELSHRVPGLQVKVLLLRDGTPPGSTQQNEPRSSEVLVPVRVTQTPVRKRKPIGNSEDSRARGKRRRR